MFVLDLPTADTTETAARALAARVVIGDVIVLSGEMGAGKTTWAQGMGRALGITETMTSPTFTLIQSYPVEGPQGSWWLHHVDLYRLDRHGELEDLALDELRAQGVLVVEWGDVGDEVWGEHLEIHLEHVAARPQARRARFRGVGDSWASQVEDLRVALGGDRC